MNRPKKPGAMTPDERLSELGALLAAGYRRLALSRQNELDVQGNTERSCTSVNASKSKKAQEVA